MKNQIAIRKMHIELDLLEIGEVVLLKLHTSGKALLGEV